MDVDPPHPIIDRPHEYSIADLRYHVGLDGAEPFIDLVLQRGDAVRRLRFLSPRQLIIEDGFPEPTSGSCATCDRVGHGRRLAANHGRAQALPPCGCRYSSVARWRLTSRRS